MTRTREENARDAQYDEVEFAGLGTMPTAVAEAPTPAPAAADETLNRQAPLGLKIPKGVAIVGCGGVGSWIAYFLALAGVRPLWLFDPDTVEIHNLNRLPLAHTDIGHNKSQALAAMLRSRIGDDTVAIPMAAFTEDLANSISLGREVKYLVCSTDTLASRQLCYDWCQHSFVQYTEAAAEGEIGSITDAPADFSTPADAAPGYASVPVWIGPAACAAVMTCAYILHGSLPRSSVLRMGWDQSMYDGSGGIKFERLRASRTSNEAPRRPRRPRAA